MNENWQDWKLKTQKWLCPPGEGVYTVHTAKEHRDGLQKQLYPEASGAEAVKKAWSDSWDQLDKTQQPCLLGVCSDAGGGIQRGANWGPLFLRKTLNDQHPESDYFDLGDIRVIPHLLHDKYLNEQTRRRCRQALYQDPELEDNVSPLSLTEDFLTEFYQRFPNRTVLALGGDHSVSYPLTKSFLKHKKSQGKKIALIHFDAHTDLLEERLGIDLCFASWCAHILEDLPSPDHLIQIGIRSSGKEKSHWEKTFGVQQYWAKELAEKGPEAVSAEILKFLKQKDVDELYVSFDIDGLDSNYASATGTPEKDGPSPDECLLILRTLQEQLPITGADLVEVAPFVRSREDVVEPRTTLSVGASLMAFFLQAMAQKE
jgi:agmatinase